MNIYLKHIGQQNFNPAILFFQVNSMKRDVMMI